MIIDVLAVARMLGGERVLHRRIRTLSELRVAVEAGLPTEALDHVIHHLVGEGSDAAEMRYRIVPKTTLKRRAARLSLTESERLERLARMTALAEYVWTDRALAREFLMSAQARLGNERPVDLARSELGTREVERILYSIEYSLPV
jgi:putative toxin-antitoxin system antitoxin component (TIGR02293 family)